MGSINDPGAGLHDAATGGQGIGFANIRERLALLFDERAQLALEANAPRGCVARIALPADAWVPRAVAAPPSTPAHAR